MPRLAVTIKPLVLRHARRAAAQREIRLSSVVERALEQFVAESNEAKGAVAWPPLVGSGALTAFEICRAIDDGRA